MQIELRGSALGLSFYFVAFTMRPQKITFGDMRAAGVRGILVYCADFRCSHSVGPEAPIDLRLSDIEPRFVCKVCGKRGAFLGAVARRQ